MVYKYVAVDIKRTKILLVGDTLQDLNKQLLTDEGQKIVSRQALWVYRVEEPTLHLIQQSMAETGATFAMVTRPQE